MGETYYDVLGVPPDASQDEIRAAYRERVLETHPDRSDDPDAAEQFQRVTTAEEVLSDETERARYDRLGHDSYVGLSQSGGRTGFAGRSSGSTGSGSSRRARGGPSHHARHRRSRERQTAETSSAAEWFVGDDRSNADRTDRDGGERAQTFGGYSVHDWDDEVDLEDERPPMDQSTWVIVGCFVLLYPGLVYASVTPGLPVFVNATVAACTLLLVGYLLTMPRIAMAAFGFWGALVPIGLPIATGLEPLSLLGSLAIGAFWVPFGYAVAVWWVLRR